MDLSWSNSQCKSVINLQEDVQLHDGEELQPAEINWRLPDVNLHFLKKVVLNKVAYAKTDWKYAASCWKPFVPNGQQKTSYFGLFGMFLLKNTQCYTVLLYKILQV